MVTDAKVSHPLAPNPCWDGHPLAAAEHARQMRMATRALDWLLRYEPGPGHGPADDGRCWRAVLGADGRWRPCCRGAA